MAKHEVKMFTCPICGYDKMPRPPEDYTICPSCGTEFWIDDVEYTPDELRARWINTGYAWHSRVVPRPADWHPVKQLERAMNPLRALTNTRYVAIPTRVVTFVASDRFTVNVPSQSLIKTSFSASTSNYVNAVARE